MDTKLIAFYLPQFHPVAENDEWWGKGFTEWTNVTKATPLFSGHYQPHLPKDLGFYDLRLDEVRHEQAALAKQYGIYGFCYYHYWFGGKKVLDMPLQKLLADPEYDFPFCVCYANENWTRIWDGGENVVLLRQEHSPEDDIRFIEDLLPALHDKRYIRVDGKPMILVYRTELFPDFNATAERWRRVAREQGLELHICRAETRVTVDPKTVGADAAVEFPPHQNTLQPLEGINFGHNQFYGRVYDYKDFIELSINRTLPDYPLYRALMLGWDNTPRKRHDGTIFINSSPQQYKNWLSYLISQTQATQKPEEQFIFINAWNEWAEGTHLEPDHKYEHSYLEATAMALQIGQKFSLNSLRKLIEHERKVEIPKHGADKIPKLRFKTKLGKKFAFEVVFPKFRIYRP